MMEVLINAKKEGNKWVLNLIDRDYGQESIEIWYDETTMKKVISKKKLKQLIPYLVTEEL